MEDIEIAERFKKKPIKNIIKKLGLKESEYELYGNYIAKINPETIECEQGKLILVTSTNPTKLGEGKTTVSIGLNDAFALINKKAVVALREPSLGPVFGIKGGATGGGLAQLTPMDKINMHFTGDFHAITSANNLLCSMIDNSLYFCNPLNLDIEKINFHRCLDLNDRALRSIELNIENKHTRKERFNITAASEMMSILTLSNNLEELEQKIGNICIGFNVNGKPVFARELGGVGAIVAVLKDAIKPNLVQTLKGNPALVHLGPFANISHGCNSVLATKYALKIADYAITEAGFGSDLGAQKFLDLMCRAGKFSPSVVVLVTTIRSLKLNGGVNLEDVALQNVEAMKRGVNLLVKHYKNLRNIYNVNVVVAVNKFPSDTSVEMRELSKELKNRKIDFEVCSPYMKGGSGCKGLALKCIEYCKNSQFLTHVYDEQDDIKTKLEKIVKNVYGASNLILTDNAKNKLEQLKRTGFNSYPVVIAKTQYSLSDDAKKIGVVEGFDFTITDFEIQSGAGYIVALAGKTLLMPGLSKEPNALKMKVENDKIIGIC